MTSTLSWSQITSCPPSSGAPVRGYVSPAQEQGQARALIGVLIGSSQTPAGKGPWARAVAGGRRHIALRRAGGEEPSRT